MLGRMANQHLSYLVQVMLGCTLVQCGAGKIEWMMLSALKAVPANLSLGHYFPG